MRLTWIGPRFGGDVLCEQQHAADMDRATVWHCTNSIESDILPQKDHSSNSIEFNDFTIFRCCGAPFGLVGVVLTREGNLY